MYFTLLLLKKDVDFFSFKYKTKKQATSYRCLLLLCVLVGAETVISGMHNFVQLNIASYY